MNQHRLCYQRDSNIINALETWGAMDTYQIRHMFFNKSSLYTAQRRLQKLAESRRLHRKRISIDLPYFYFSGKPLTQLEHRIGTNYARLMLLKQLRSWETWHYFQYEPTQYKKVRPDGFAVFKNTTTGKFRCLFIEFDRAFNDFDKIPKYNDLYLNKLYKNEWWAKNIDRFPSILVLSEDVKKAQKDYVDDEQYPKFIFYNYDSVREGFKC